MVLKPSTTPPADLGASCRPLPPLPDSIVQEAANVLARIHASAKEIFRDGVCQLSFQAMGTQCRVALSTPATRVAAVSSMVIEWVASFEAKYSRFLPTS